jgi:hypothetical protein
MVGQAMTRARRILEDGGLFDDVFGDRDQMAKPEITDRDLMYKFQSELKVGDVIKVGSVKFRVSQFFHQPFFAKEGTSGTKWYAIKWVDNFVAEMYLTNGSGESVGSPVVTGKVERVS